MTYYGSGRLAPEGTPKTWDTWQDCLGQTYMPGDRVAIATINNKSPQLVIGTVVRINRIDSQGALIEDISYDYKSVREGERKQPEPTYTPSCTVTVLPEIDARGFYRWGSQKWDPSLMKYIPRESPKAVTYRLPQNIIKLLAVPDETC